MDLRFLFGDRSFPPLQNGPESSFSCEREKILSSGVNPRLGDFGFIPIRFGDEIRVRVGRGTKDLPSARRRLVLSCEIPSEGMDANQNPSQHVHSGPGNAQVSVLRAFETWRSPVRIVSNPVDDGLEHDVVSLFRRREMEAFLSENERDA